MLYGDDPLKLNNYNYAPSLAAIIQSGNLYVYAMSNPTRYADPDGEGVILAWFAANAGEILVGAAVDAVATGLAYHADGKSLLNGFLYGGGSGLVSGIATSFTGGAKGKIAISTTVSVLGYLIENNGKIDRDGLARAFVEGIVTGASSVYLDELHEFTKNNDLLLELSSAYTERTGAETKYFLQGIITAIMEMEDL